jgi:SAM-dependent methyltransferase
MFGGRVKRWKDALPPAVKSAVRHVLIFRFVFGFHPRSCPICDYKGYFRTAGFPPRLDAKCPKCGSLERHRLFFLRVIQNNQALAEMDVLHFAPEPVFSGVLAHAVRNYKTADLSGRGVDFELNIEDISLPANSFDGVLCNHVLEHVDSCLALAELYRVLKPGGHLYAMVPIVEGWQYSYEDKNITNPEDRVLHFGQRDHIVRFGQDFRVRMKNAGFQLTEFTNTGSECVEYGLEPGQRVFVGEKPHS